VVGVLRFFPSDWQQCGAEMILVKLLSAQPQLHKSVRQASLIYAPPLLSGQHKKKGWTEHQPKGIISYPANNNGNLFEERRGENNRSASSSLTDRQKERASELYA